MPAVTLFVKKLPASTTNENLGELFSEIGPLKNCFVVRDKETEQCRGIGYVTFCMEDDAQRALKEVKEYEGQKIVTVVAKKKPDNKKRRKTKIKEESEDTESPKEPAKSPKEPAKSPKEPAKSPKEPAKSLKEPAKSLKEPAKSLKEPAKSPKEPAESSQKFQGLRKNKLKARLIIRNLSFKCKEEDLKKVFSEFGEVLEANIALKPDGKMRGFAFVQFKNMLQASKALAGMNMKEIKGRQVAVDWAISKDKYIATQATSSAGSKKEVKTEDAEVDAKQGAKNKPTLHQETNSESEEDSDDGGDDDDEDEQSSAEEEEEEKENESESDKMNSESEGDDDDDDVEDSDEESKAPPKKKKALPSDVNEGRTIFIRNMSFDTEGEDLEEVLLQFGEMNYVKVVMHASTGHSKGCAFAQFKTKEAAEKCIAAAQNENESGGMRLDGRKLYIVAAVSKEDAVKFKDKKPKTQTGTRNLYLAREGLIRPGTQPAEGVSESDMAKRIRFQELKRQKLKDISVFVSKTRLCIHNLPKRVQQPEFRKICLRAAGDKGARITECRVMYDKKPVRGQVMGQSLGYGFVEFKEHEYALKTLRHLNNNPDIFGAQKRPIAEFAMEDTRKLKLKARRQQNSRKQAKKDSSQEGTPQHNPGKKQNAVQARYMGNVGKQQKNQGSKYTGFMTKAEVEHVELADGKKRQKVLPMPSHSGPKIRKRDKGKQPVQPKKPKKGPSRKERNMSSVLEKPNQNKKQFQNAKPPKRTIRSKEDVRFDSLVQRYKNKLMGNSNAKTPVKKSKWFS